VAKPPHSGRVRSLPPNRRDVYARLRLVSIHLEVEGMAEDETNRVRLPGLFRWEEVCDVFRVESGHDDQWHFEVQQASEHLGGGESLYIVHATEGRAGASDVGK
jgi:hypothetical protein